MAALPADDLRTAWSTSMMGAVDEVKANAAPLLRDW